MVPLRSVWLRFLPPVLLAVISFAYLSATSIHAPPNYDDAIMTLRYASHVADGQGMAWNRGEGPVDGSTDMLATLLIAGMSKLGMSIETAALSLYRTSNVLLLILAYVVPVYVLRANPIFGIVSALFLLTGPGHLLADVYFATPFYALCVALTWTCALVWQCGTRTKAWAIAFGATSLMMALARPEGAFLTAFILLGLAIANKGKGVLPMFLWAIIFNGVLGGLYFAARWQYFGYPLPNPFYRKGGGVLYWGNLSVMIDAWKRYCFAPAFLLAIALLVPLCAGIYRKFAGRSKESAEPLPESPWQSVFGHAVAVLVPLVGYTVIWFLLSNEMNYKMRFQFPLLVLMALAWPLLIPQPFRAQGLEADGPVGKVIAAFLVVAIVQMVLNHREYTKELNCERGAYQIAKALQPYASKGYTMAVSEAGGLPYFSQWTAIDTWGLNDPWIAHHGGITPEYLDEKQPAIIMFHGYFSPGFRDDYTSLSGSTPITWDDMTYILNDYAKSRGYILAAAYGNNKFDTHTYYVDAKCPDAAEFVKIIANTKYTIRCNEPTIDFAKPENRIPEKKVTRKSSQRAACACDELAWFERP